MKKLIHYLLITGVLINFMSCNSQSCNDLPTQFNSYQQAKKEIKSANFKIEENINTSRSTFVEGASYYSCDGQIGYLLIKIRNTEYIHQNVPITLWKNFKQADSFGKFYNLNIKGNYNLLIDK